MNILIHTCICIYICMYIWLCGRFWLSSYTAARHFTNLGCGEGHSPVTMRCGEGMVTEGKRKKTTNIIGTQSKAQARWLKHLRLVQATP